MTSAPIGLLLLKILFWFGLAYLAYVEVGYLAWLGILAAFRRPPPEPEPFTPPLTVLLAAYNEAGVIRQRLENLLSQDYPPELVQILVSSDGSDDGTDEIVRAVAQEHPERQILLRRSLQRQGKIAALRQLEAEIRGEVVVFTDADALFQPGALRALARHFRDPQVGAVSGQERRPPSGVAGRGRGEGLYNRLETQVKRLEGRLGDQVMVNGGIFAVRRALLPEVPDHLTHDAIVPVTLRLQGLRTRYEPQAVSVEAYELDTAQDWRRRIRTVMQAFQSYLYVPQALNPLRTGWYALQILSHRFLRWFVLPVLALTLLSSLLLWPQGGVYALGAGAQLACYLAAALGAWLDRRGKRPALFYFPFYFVYIHAAAFYAIWLTAQGRKVAAWQPAVRRI